ncbi:MAG: methyltransferase [Gammaproteobacteria bacterium]|nr:MAG: methyltransferase [Gammaproteobacteria bacterium]
MINPKLAGIPETMLWTLHNRASEAARPDGVIKDPHCLSIYRSLDYDYEKSFGKPDGSHGIRSLIFDRKIREFLAQHPDGVIINLGEGLETQRYRIADEEAVWVSLDLPEGIAVREHFIQPDDRHLHLGISAFDTAWFDSIPAGRAVFITAQGLLMFFSEQQVRRLLQLIVKRFPDAWLMFDHLPRWMSAMTCREKGLNITPHYRAPRMPWGINKNEIEPTLSRWLDKSISVEDIPFRFPRGKWRIVKGIVDIMPVLRNRAYGISFIKTVA